MTSVEVYHSQP